jgi:hypothetical protein
MNSDLFLTIFLFCRKLKKYEREICIAREQILVLLRPGIKTEAGWLRAALDRLGFLGVGLDKLGFLGVGLDKLGFLGVGLDRLGFLGVVSVGLGWLDLSMLLIGRHF